MNFDPAVLPIAGIVLVFLAAMGTPLAASVFFACAVVLFLNPQPLPAEFTSSYSLAMQLNSPALISIPLFALAGELAVASGITKRLLDVADAFFGFGNHAVGKRTVAGCTLYATVSGVGPAAVREAGKRLIPSMIDAGYRRSSAAAILASAAAISIVIPASIPLTIYAATVGMQTNIVFTASFLPGLLMAVLLFVAVTLHDRWSGCDSVALRPRREKRWIALKNARYALLLPILVLSFLFTGFLTAPEAAAFSSLYAALIGLWTHKRLDRRGLRDALVRATVTAAAVLLMAGIGGLAIKLLQSAGIIQSLCTSIYSLAGGRIGSIIVINIILLLAGCLLDMPAIINLIAPLFIPLAAMSGIDLPQFGVMVVVNLAIGLVTPPQAQNLAAAAREAGVGIWQASRRMPLFLVAMLVCLGLVSYWPSLTLWLPRFFGWPV